MSQATIESPVAPRAEGDGAATEAIDASTEVAHTEDASEEAIAAPAFVPAGPDVLRDHAYDEIQEFDNPMPGWWKWLFIATVIFSVVYIAFAFGGLKQLSPVAQFEQVRAEEQRAQNSKKLSDDGASLIAYTNDAKVRSAGAAVFAANCALCHKPDGSGLVGPNMTDNVYLRIKTIDDIPRFIRSGSPNGAMPSFARMAPNDIVRVATFVASLRGKNLPGKPAEGVEIPPWGATGGGNPSPTAAPKPNAAPATAPAAGPAIPSSAPK